MEFLCPADLDDALEARASQPDALPLMGGTDVMVELNFDRRRPEALLDLTRVAELATWEHTDDLVRLGAGVTYARVIRELGTRLPSLAIASRTVGSPQIRNRGTVGGNLGAASPAGDAHPALLAAFAEVELASRHGVRRVPVDEFFTGVKHHAGRPDELVTAVWVPAATGPQQFSKIGTRNAMVIAVASFGLALHPDLERVGTGVGSAAPTPRRARHAEDFLSAELDWAGRRDVPDSVATEFGRLVATAASPIDDVRGTADYRRHALSVMARRCLAWAWAEHQGRSS
ncbi:xanthine dehydrogenase family protein subunit M [Nocardioides sp. JQ2195]|uniref:FAD binding domain-containing protein n=1 Tax=Nocardioides sp. JQ2195 TaxID=2592334 RepID=UPI00143E3F70|nr:FAD binding domain-containing protein [Nocardioides sp. JQ2195]QIX27777.1 xanthine dehydrogenase family protein subunit M [Nocardioides sp. JQ2195]